VFSSRIAFLYGRLLAFAPKILFSSLPRMVPTK